jgi:predicted AAA+ superfamily ATPase
VVYLRRVVENELDELHDLPAIALEGAKGVGKTATATTRARTVYALDRPGQLEIVQADPERLSKGERPILIDEWQRYKESWDIVRRAVDADRTGGQFLLTGSAPPRQQPAHSGAGRIVTIRMRPMTLAERGVGVPTVSLTALLAGDRPPAEGETDVTLDDYVDEIIDSGFPGLRDLQGRALRASLDGYIDRIVEKEFPLLGLAVRNKAALRRWLTAYAAATSTTASAETIRDAAMSREGTKPARTTTKPYSDALEGLWVVDPLPAWTPSTGQFSRIVGPPKHHLADPALAARLLNADHDALVRGGSIGPTIRRTGTLLGSLFESLACLSVRVFSQAAEGRVSHYRTKGGEREVDFIVEASDRRILAIEAKLSAVVTRDDTKHLRWLRDQLGDRFADGAVLSTGSTAYRDPDGIAIVPLALLGA